MTRCAAALLFATLALPSVVSAQDAAAEPSLDALWAGARAADARTDYPTAVELYEAYAARCLGSSTAVLESPCELLPDAIARSFELARALGDDRAAERAAEAHARHLHYAEPRESLAMGYELARMHLDAGRLEEADAALERWVGLHPHPPVGQRILADALRGSIAAALGRTRDAQHLFRSAERQFAESQSELDAGPVPAALVREALAEARLARAEPLVARFMDARVPRARAVRDRAELFTRVITPWRVRTERALLLARMELERIYELGSPRHSVVAAARIGEMYRHLGELHAALPLPDDEWFRVLVREGEDRPGFDQAVAHFSTCVRWADHHGVAPSWRQRCEEGLHALSPQDYPLAEELAGHASYRPAAVAWPGPAEE
jgi:tetratricopeptide (TPR) repeat protein